MIFSLLSNRFFCSHYFPFMIIYFSVYVTFEKFVAAEDNQDYDNVPERTYMVTEEWAKEDNFRFQPKPHPCDRTCKTGDSKRCHFVFIVERITSLGKPCYECPRGDTADCYRPHCVQTDGYERGITTVNRTMPGPPVVVCQGDEVLVDVYNHLREDTTSIHFHGEHFRNGEQYMDGVPYITQCPILPGTKFSYKWKAVIPGSNWYHSHSSYQRGDGLLGMYIVRLPPEQEVHSLHYDFDLTDHYIIAQEWFHGTTEDTVILGNWNKNQGANSDNIIINGRGRMNNDTYYSNNMYKNFHDLKVNPFEVNLLDRLPLATFFVTANKRYRFRLLSPGFTLAPIRMSIDNHTLYVIATDSGSVKLKEVKSIVIFPGERYDFVLKADQSNCSKSCGMESSVVRKHSNGVFAIRFHGYMNAGYTRLHQKALLIYNKKGVKRKTALRRLSVLNTDTIPELHSGIINDMKDPSLHPILNFPNYAPYEGGNFTDKRFVSLNELEACIGMNCVSDIHGKDKNGSTNVFYKLPGDGALNNLPPDQTVYLAYDMYFKEHSSYYHSKYYPKRGDIYTPSEGVSVATPQFNHISFRLPSSGPLISQDLEESHFCDAESMKGKDCKTKFCECVHRIKIKINDTVEMFIIDEGRRLDLQHPIHIHGYSPYIIATERHAVDPESFYPIGKKPNIITVDEVRKLNEAGKIKKNYEDPIQKDTIPVPDAGFAVMRFRADNPGFWIMHCHIDFHNHEGMALVLQIGEKEKGKPIVETEPPEGFPKCHSFKGEINPRRKRSVSESSFNNRSKASNT